MCIRDRSWGASDKNATYTPKKGKRPTEDDKIKMDIYISAFHINSAHDGQLAGFTLPMYADSGNTGYSVLCVNHEQCFASAGQTNLFIATNTGRALSIQEHTTSYNTWSGSTGRYVMFAGTYRAG